MPKSTEYNRYTVYMWYKISWVVAIKKIFLKWMGGRGEEGNTETRPGSAVTAEAHLNSRLNSSEL